MNATVEELGSRMSADEFGYWVARASLKRDADAKDDLASVVEHELAKARQE